MVLKNKWENTWNGWKIRCFFLARVTGVNFSAKEVKYHADCRIKYQTEAEGKVTQKRSLAGKDIPTEESTSVWCRSREIHKKLFEALVCYLKETAFAEKEEVFLQTFMPELFWFYISSKLFLAKFSKINLLLLFLHFGLDKKA